ncbi:MAG: DUF448 domain-containing protein [Proteobacteria bacterium]|nr:DUF448 domain-containing protein [Pseudomonadota bacterium]
MQAAMTSIDIDDDADEDGPTRRCIATGNALPAEQLIRFVVGPDGSVVPDLAEKLPGRGIWLSAERVAAELAVRKKLFAKAARQAVTVAVDLPDVLERLLVRRCQDLIGLAKRSGQLTVGHDRVIETIERGRVGLVGVATDAGGERFRVERAASELPMFTAFGALEIAQAAGRERVSFFAVGAGGLASALARDGKRLSGFRQV